MLMNGSERTSEKADKAKFRYSAFTARPRSRRARPYRRGRDVLRDLMRKMPHPWLHRGSFAMGHRTGAEP